MRTPDGASIDDVQSYIVDKKDWIYRKLAGKDALLAPPVTKQFVNGEGFAYLGRNYRLVLVNDQEVDVRLERGRFKMRNDRVADGPEVMRHWYTATGQTWLRGRVQPWAHRLEVEDPQLRVLDLGCRWGSARSDRINIHWATLQLRPALMQVGEFVHQHVVDQAAAKKAAAEQQAAVDAAVAAALAQRAAAPAAAAAPGAAAGGDQVAKLKDLADLKAQGLLTDEEFAAQKAKILGA